MTDPAQMTDADLLAEWNASDGESERAEAVLAEIERRHLDL